MEQFEIIFLDDDKNTVLDTQLVGYGEKAAYKGPKPTKEPTEKETYTFVGWENEEKLESVTERVILIAKYSVEVNNNVAKDDFYDASLQNAEQANLAAVVDSGKKLSDQQKAFEKDPRTAEEIVADIVANGKTEVGQEQKREDIDR